MALVSYASSSDSGDEDMPGPPQAKRRKLSGNEVPEKQMPSISNAPPPLPTTFHDLYSSTVRASTHDDPALHGGRKRVTPHVDGNWPTHVFLEWHPSSVETQHLQALTPSTLKRENNSGITSLLHNELGVSLPLHISLSRPLVLKTEQKDAFLAQLKKIISTSGSRALTVKIASTAWHPNETRTRWFLVLALDRSALPDLQKLLGAANATAAQFGQPKLYYEGGSTSEQAGHTEKFHISIAWTLQDPTGNPAVSKIDITTLAASTGKPDLQSINVSFTEVKVRIGQDVTAIPLGPRRSHGSLFT